MFQASVDQYFKAMLMFQKNKVYAFLCVYVRMC